MGNQILATSIGFSTSLFPSQASDKPWLALVAALRDTQAAVSAELKFITLPTAAIN